MIIPEYEAAIRAVVRQEPDPDAGYELYARAFLYYRSHWRTIVNGLREDLLSVTDSIFSLWDSPGLFYMIRNFLKFAWLPLSDANTLLENLGLARETYKEMIHRLWSDCLAVAYWRLYSNLVEAPADLIRACTSGSTEALIELWNNDLAYNLSLLEAVERTPELNMGKHSPKDLMSLQLKRISLFQENTLSIAHPASLVCDELTAHILRWVHTTNDVEISEREAGLLALNLLLVDEEQARTNSPVWVPVAGEHGGVGQLTLAALHYSATDGESKLVEIAPWSRYQLDIGTLEDAVTELHQWLASRMEVQTPTNITPMRYRVVFNPPGTFPAEEGRIKEVKPTGTSIGLALALAVYAANNQASLGRYAASGKIKEGLRLEEVTDVGDKLVKINLYNMSHPQSPITHVLLPNKNITPEIVEKAKNLGLTLNRTLSGTGRVDGSQLKRTLQPGVLYDGAQLYAQKVADAFGEGKDYGQGAALLKNVEIPSQLYTAADAVVWRELADRVLSDIQQISDAPAAGRLRATGTPELAEAYNSKPVESSPRAYLLPVPHEFDPRNVTAYLAVTLASRRSIWARDLSKAADLHNVWRRPPLPVVLDGAYISNISSQGMKTGMFERAVVEVVTQLGSPSTLPAYVRDAWRRMDGEFVLIMTGNDYLVKQYITSAGGFLDEVGGRGVTGHGRHFLVLVAEDLEQMHCWAADLEEAGEPLMPESSAWYDLRAANL